MELCCSSSRAAVSNHLPLASAHPCKNSFSSSIRPSLRKPQISLRQNSGLLNLGTPLLRATTSEDSTGIYGQPENVTGVVATMQEPSDEQLPTVDSDTSAEAPKEQLEPVDSDTSVEAPKEQLEPVDSDTSAVPTEESPMGEVFKISELLDKLNLKLDTEDTYSVLIYGSGALIALWLASAVVGAIDSIPVFPKVFELVGLSYTVWFSTRYLIFKKNRDEFLAKIEELKQQVIGSTEE